MFWDEPDGTTRRLSLYYIIMRLAYIVNLDASCNVHNTIIYNNVVERARRDPLFLFPSFLNYSMFRSSKTAFTVNSAFSTRGNPA